MKTIHASILSIGDEILIGQITDTNSVFIAEQLSLNGIKVNDMQTVGDSREQIFEALNCSLQHSDLILLTGGLGPTDDDITKETLCEYFSTELVLNETVLTDVEQFIESRGFKTNKRNRMQALVPQSCTVLRNGNGTAPGMCFKKNGSLIISMPAVPFEMKEMFLEKVLPLLHKQFELPRIVHRTILTHGIPESLMAEKLENWEQSLPPEIKLAYLPSPERLRLRLSTQAENKTKADKLLETEIIKLRKIIGKAIYGEGDYYLEQAVYELLISKQKTIATAESCTGGNIAGRITSIAGSSQIFLGGLVAYSNTVKINQLNVPKELITEHGAVSRPVVEAMVQGALSLFDTDYAIAVSGVAGPGGGSPKKPVGTVWLAVADKHKIFSKKYVFGKRRNINIQRASAKGLDMLRKFILDFY